MPPALGDACPLCLRVGLQPGFEASGRTFSRCATCDLLSVAASDRPDAAAENAHYLMHENSPDDPRYREFLDRLLAPLTSKLEPGARGLDYGSGPGPTASVMLAERGFSTALYDPFFAPDTGQRDRVYDFVLSTESVEHFHAPIREFERIDRMVRPGGWIALMTEMVDERLSAKWWYLHDPTHVCFYSMDTMRWIARRFTWTIESPARNVVLLHKGPSQQGSQ